MSPIHSLLGLRWCHTAFKCRQCKLRSTYLCQMLEYCSFNNATLAMVIFQCCYILFIVICSIFSIDSLMPCSVFCHFISNVIWMFWSFQVLALLSSTAFCFAVLIRILMSFVQLTELVLYDPRNLKLSTYSNTSLSIIMLICSLYPRQQPWLFWYSVQ